MGVNFQSGRIISDSPQFVCYGCLFLIRLPIRAMRSYLSALAASLETNSGDLGEDAAASVLPSVSFPVFTPLNTWPNIREA